MKHLTFISGILSIALLNGCATKEVAAPIKTTDPILISLEESSIYIQKETRKISQIVQSQYGGFEPVKVNDIRLNRVVEDFYATALASKVLLKLSEHLNEDIGSNEALYKVKTVGNIPVREPVVDVAVKSDSIINVINEIDSQVGKNVYITIDEITKLITLKY